MRVKRFDGSIQLYGEDDEMSEEEALLASWDYWETRGLEHPMKRAGGITEMKPIAKKDLLNAAARNH